MFQFFSKIWIVVAVAVFAVAGIFCWQYFETQKAREKNDSILTVEQLKLKWEKEKQKMEIEGGIMAIADVNNDGNDDLIIARPAKDNEEWHYGYITVISWDRDKFIPIWKSADKFSIRGLWVGDVNNNGKNNIIVSTSTNFPDFYRCIFEMDSTTLMDENWDKKWDKILEEAVDKYWTSLKSSSVYDHYWYWKINSISDQDNDGEQELLVDVFFLPVETVPYSEFLALKWDENTKSFDRF